MDVTPEGAAEYFQKLGNAFNGQEFFKQLQPYMDRAFDLLRPKLATYPGAHSGPLQFKSRKQMAFYFWMVRKGLITQPYERTGTLGAGWQGDVTYEVTDTGLTGTLSNAASDWRGGRPYGRFVMGAAQQPMHAGTWTLADAILEQNKQACTDIIAEGIAAIARGAVKA